MQEMGWSWIDLYHTPETVVISNLRIIGLKVKIEKQKEAEMKAKHKVGAK
jgi:hypothetical protein